MSTTASTKRPLAILGGTFDPVHLAHLRVAWEAAEVLGAELRLMPANVPPHRPQPVATPAQRLAILQAALAGQNRLTIDARELVRDGRSYSIDTLIDLRREIDVERPLVMLVGSDAFAGLASWHRWRELFDHAHIGVLTRPGRNHVYPESLSAELAQRQVSTWSAAANRSRGCVFQIAVTALDVSATQVRRLLREGHEPRYLLPDAVLADPALLDPYRGTPQHAGGSIKSAADGPVSDRAAG